VTPHVDSLTRVKVLQAVQQMGVPLAMSQVRAEFQVKEPSHDAIEVPTPPAAPRTENRVMALSQRDGTAGSLD
jgi:hypothetical protein